MRTFEISIQGVVVTVHPVRSVISVLLTGLLVVSCSSDSQTQEGEDVIDGVQTGEQEEPEGEGGESESPEQTPSDDGIDRPEIDLPDDMNNVFEDTETGDETKNAIIADVMEGINAVDMAVAQSDPENEAVKFYYTRDGLTNVGNYIRAAAESGEAGRTWTGTVEYYDFVVNNEDRRRDEPIVTYCSDRSETQTVELATGEILTGEQYAGGQGMIQVVVQQNDQGIWQVTRVLPRDEDGDTQCRR